MLRISPSSQATEGGSSFLNIDARKKQVSVYDPTTCGSTSNAEKRTGVSAPKMFAFDAIFSPDDAQAEVCSSSLPDVIQAVVGGNDGCLFVYGHSKLGKTHTMVGSSDSVQELGVIPCAISWLFRLIYEQRQKTGSRFSVRVSALEVSGRNEVLRDLLAEYATGTESSGTSPAVYLKDDPIFGTQLTNQSELRAPTAEKAGYLLDAAVAARNTDGEDEGKNSHFLFTLHLYQYRVEKGGKGGVAGGRSRLHLFDLGSCEKIPPKPRDGSAGGCLTLSAMGNVILALFNGQKHVPYKESKLTQLLREAMSSLTCRVAMIAHVSPQPTNYSEVLGTIQLASRVHRMRRRKLKYPMAGPMESSCDEKGVCVRPYVKMHAVNEDGVKSGSSDPDYTSSSEQSCDTVIYVGTGGVAINDRDLTDNEGPPASLPVLPKSNRSPQSSKSAVIQKSQDSSVNISESKDRSSLSSSANKAPVVSEEMPKTIAKITSSNTELSGLTTVNDSPAQNKLNRDTKSQGTLKISHGSTQTPSTDPFSAHSKTSQTFQPQRKANIKHRPAQQKQDGAHSSSQDKPSTSCKPTAGQKDTKPKSDEMWIDGPRFSKPKFDSRTLHQLQKEQWVDGPPVMYGFMDDHKQNMIRRWVEEHSHHVQEGGKRKKNEVWIDFPPGSKDGKSTASAKIENSSTSGTPPNISSESSNLQASKEEKVCNKDIFLKDDGHDLNRDCPSRKRNERLTSAGKEEDENISETSQQDYEVEDEHDLLDDEADSASNSADVDETDNEENAEAIGYDSELHALHIGHSDITPQEFQAAMYKAQQEMLEYSQAGEDTEVEMIEVMEPDEPVPMVDSCLQVNEEDIIAECWLHANVKITENPLPEVDQGSYDGREHPLRILSEEDLNLPSSFTDSRSVSVDLDSVSVPDTCREGVRGKGDLTWRLLYGNMFQKIKEQHQQQRRTMEDINSTVKGSLLNEKLERIARLRELMQSSSSRRFEQVRSGASSPTCLTKSNTLLPRDSRLTLSEMLYGSKDSSMEDLSEVEINSTQSEPAELDIDKYDYKFNIKPMNGLKLEAFYNKIHKVPSFLEQFSGPKPMQVVPPLIASAQEKAFSQPQLDAGRSGSFIKDKQGKFTQGSSLTRATKKKVNESASRETGDLKRASSLKKASLHSLKHPDGSSNPHLNKHPSMIQLQRDSSGLNSVQGSYNLPQRSPDGACTSDSENISLCSVRSVPKKPKNVPSELNEISKRTDQRTGVSSLTYKNIDTSQLTVGPSPTHSSKSRQARTKGCSGETAPIIYGEVQGSQAFPSSSRSKETPLSSNYKTLQKSSIATRGSLRSSSGKYHPNNNSNSSGGCKSSRPNGTNGCGKLPTRSSPTSSSTSGVTTTCCTSVKQKEKVMSMKNKPPTTCTHPKQKQSILGDKRSQRTKSICRSTSSPSTCVDSGDTLLTDVTDSDHYHVTRHASVSGALASPYHKLPHVQVSHHHRTSSGHGSDSSVNSIEPREAKELLIKGAKTLQFSGTSSGYESMLRDSEGTPLSSSQESGTEGSVDREGRGRKGRRRSQGSSKRSLSAPARSPPSPTVPPSSTAVSQQPVANSRACQLRRTDRSLRRSEEEVCCTSLLCCRLLDFY